MRRRALRAYATTSGSLDQREFNRLRPRDVQDSQFGCNYRFLMHTEVHRKTSSVFGSFDDTELFASWLCAADVFCRITRLPRGNCSSNSPDGLQHPQRLVVRFSPGLFDDIKRQRLLTFQSGLEPRKYFAGHPNRSSLKR